MTQDKIYVGNLAYSTTQSTLNDYFSQYGDITDLKLITDRDSGRSKGFAFITFSNADEAQNATKANGSEIDGRAVRVNISEDRRREGSGSGRR